jgi:hypothetical protein
MPKAAPRRIIRQDRRDLRESEHEDQVEEQLERSDALLALSMLLAHSRTLAHATSSVEPRHRIGELGARADIELSVNVAQVVLNCLGAEEHRRRRFSRGAALRQ